MAKNRFIATILLTLLLASVPLGWAQTIQDSAICYGYSPTTLMPKGEGTTVFNHTEKVGFWVKIQDPPEAEYEIIWFDPNGNQHRIKTVEVVPKEGEDWGIVFDSILVSESTARRKLGVWTVSLYIDGTEYVSKQFEIISMKTIEQILDAVDDIRGDLESLAEEKNQLLAQNEELRQELEDLQARYEELEENTRSDTEYQLLQDQYDELLEDYEALKENLVSTRTMMYAAIVVALVSVFVAVYFGALKK